MRILEIPETRKFTGFDFFDSRVVFVKVNKSSELADFQKELTAFARRELRLLNADYKDRGFHPHMTIGFRDLKKSLFGAVRDRFALREYKRVFEAKSLSLLKHDGNKWAVIRQF